MDSAKNTYRRFSGPVMQHRHWPSRTLTHAPTWCSVDLRDGNQALPNPMSVEQKVEFFRLLARIGFKEIEVGFPAASDTEYAFVRRLIDDKLIPDDVTIQVLVQAREELIRKTAESLVGAKKVIIHLYNSTSPAQREIVFGFRQDETVALAVQGVKWIRQYADQLLQDTRVTLQYSPESFSATEEEFSLRICEAVMDEWKPIPEHPIIINLPCTVEVAMPNVYADQVEFMCKHLRKKGSRIISVHTHNDRGTGVAATELGMLAGARRVEGTLFGNGERTGNVDIVTVALNLFTQGIDPGLDFSDLESIREQYEALTSMSVHQRHPYAGELVFTAFSGSHQDAVKKGFQHMRSQRIHDDQRVEWNVPYFIIDPADIGRRYQPVRVNSQSGKGGLAYVLQHSCGFNLPKDMQRDFAAIASPIIDALQREVTAQEVCDMFMGEYMLFPPERSVYELVSSQPNQRRTDTSYLLSARIKVRNLSLEVTGNGNGPVDAFVHALGKVLTYEVKVLEYHEHSLGSGSEAPAVAYVLVELSDGQKLWGAAKDLNIANAAIRAVLNALNRSQRKSRG